MKSFKYALKFKCQFKTATPLMIRSGFEGEFTDSSIEKTPDGKLYINGYVWASLIRRALLRIKGADELSSEIGKYDEEDKKGVSPLWTDASFIELPVTDVRPGIKINRSYGIAERGALFQDEIAPQGLTGELKFTMFISPSYTEDEIKAKLLKALSVINSGVESIGAGWSYGFGRLNIEKVWVASVDLAKHGLWSEELHYEECPLPVLSGDELVKSWRKLKIQAKILDGQLLAVHTDEPTQQIYEEIPDSFVYSGHVINNGKTEHRYIIPGRTIRQSLFSVPIERKLRTYGKNICMEVGTQRDGCKCIRCQWFGSTEKGGIIAVTDAVVEDADSVVLHRIQLDEHSMQNMNLFSSEYLSKGKFSFTIYIDKINEEGKDLLKEIKDLLDEITKNAPKGWYRIGATTTCTGQIEILKIEENL